MRKDLQREMAFRRDSGSHSTTSELFRDFILPMIGSRVRTCSFMDLFCGEGNLILPILEYIPPEERTDYFKKNIFLVDKYQDKIEKCIRNVEELGVEEKVAEENIFCMDSLNGFPALPEQVKKRIIHITNPPYLYSGYTGKTENREKFKPYFKGSNEKFQDLYQIAMMNDLRNGIEEMIYIIPSNFLYGGTGSDLIRKSFLPHYEIKDAYIFEGRLFRYTGTNVSILHFKKSPSINNSIEFQAFKINSRILSKNYVLNQFNSYRPSGGFQEFVSRGKRNNLSITFHLKMEDIQRNPGDHRIKLMDSTRYVKRRYFQREFYVNSSLYERIKQNFLYLRTLDTGSLEGRAGIYRIDEQFGVDGIYESGKSHRTNPIQIFIEPNPGEEAMVNFMYNFNRNLNRLRESTDSDFLTTYRYSDFQKYTRKYLGLIQARQLMEITDIS
ncbi:MAG: N-6 DNA methylase [Cuniculiplasma sp.]